MLYGKGFDTEAGSLSFCGFGGFLVVFLAFLAGFPNPHVPILESASLWRCFCRQRPPFKMLSRLEPDRNPARKTDFRPGSAIGYHRAGFQVFCFGLRWVPGPLGGPWMEAHGWPQGNSRGASQGVGFRGFWPFSWGSRPAFLPSRRYFRTREIDPRALDGLRPSLARLL